MGALFGSLAAFPNPNAISFSGPATNELSFALSEGNANAQSPWVHVGFER